MFDAGQEGRSAGLIQPNGIADAYDPAFHHRGRDTCAVSERCSSARRDRCFHHFARSAVSPDLDHGCTDHDPGAVGPWQRREFDCDVATGRAAFDPVDSQLGGGGLQFTGSDDRHLASGPVVPISSQSSAGVRLDLRDRLDRPAVLRSDVDGRYGSLHAGSV